VLILVTHHIVMDGRSTEVLLADLARLYEAERSGVPADLEAPAGPRAPEPDEASRAGDLAYWKQALAGLPDLDLAADRPRPQVRSGRGASIGLPLSAATSQRISDLARQHATTEFAVLLASVWLLMAHLSGQRDFAVGTSSALRTAESVGTVGLGIEQVPLRARLAGDPSFTEVLRQARDQSRQSLARQGISFAEIVRELAPTRDLSRTPLFQVALEFALPGVDPALFAGLRTIEVAVPVTVSKYDLTFTVAHSGPRLTVEIEYALDLFDQPSVERIGTGLAALLDAATADPDAGMSELLTGIEKAVGAAGAEPVEAGPDSAGKPPEDDPEPELMQVLGQAWADVLGRCDIGPDDDFFQLGGDSLLALRLVSQLRRMFGAEFPLELIFRQPTLRRLAPEIERAVMADLDGPFPAEDGSHQAEDGSHQAQTAVRAGEAVGPA
jgi:acyl carrier protein